MIDWGIYTAVAVGIYAMLIEITGGHGNKNSGSKVLYAGVAFAALAIMQPRGGHPECKRLSNLEWLAQKETSNGKLAGEQGPPAGDGF